MKNQNNLAFAITAFIAAFALSYILYDVAEDQKFERKYNYIQNDLDYYRAQYPRKQGFTTFYNGKDLFYNIISLDSGKNWYLIDNKLYNDSSQVKIIDDVEKVYPGLMKTIAAVDSLIARSERRRIFLDKNGLKE